MIFNITIDRDEDGVWIAECPCFRSHIVTPNNSRIQ